MSYKDPNRAAARRWAAKRRRRQMTVLENAVLIMVMGRDRDNPIKGSYIADTLHSDIRMIRQTVRDLVLIHRKPIGSITGIEGGGAGYYWVTDPRVMMEESIRLRKRGVSILKRAAALKRIARRMDARQENLALEEPLPKKIS